MAREEFTFGLGLEPGMGWPAYVKALADHHVA